MTTSNWDERPDEIEIDLGYYYHLLKSQWLLLMLVALGAGLIAFTMSSLQEPVYRSTATIFVDSRRGNGAADITDIRTSQSLAETYAELITSRTIREKAATLLEIDNNEELSGVVSADPIAGTQLIRISSESRNTSQAALIANTVSQILIDEILEMETFGYTQSEANYTAQIEALELQIAEVVDEIDALRGATDTAKVEERGRLENLLVAYNRDYSAILLSLEDIRLSKFEATSNMRLFEDAVPTLTPIRPRVTLNTVIGVVLGLIASIGFILLRELLDDSVRDIERISRRLNIPILGQVLHFDADNERLITTLKPRSPQAESFRSVRLNLDFASPDSELKTLLITSAAPSEGKSTLASNLGTVMAQGGKQTILIDSDLRKPTQHRIFSIMNMQGLSKLFLSSIKTPFETVVMRSPVEGLSLVPSGALPPNPSELLYSRRAGEIIQEASSLADMVIVDAPPVTIMTDAVALARQVDGVVLVVRFGKTKQRMLNQAVEMLRKVDANILGFVLTDVGGQNGRYSYYYQYRYANYYDAESLSPEPKSKVSDWFSSFRKTRRGEASN